MLRILLLTSKSQIISEENFASEKRKNLDWDPESDETPNISFKVHEINNYRITELANESATSDKREKRLK